MIEEPSPHPDHTGEDTAPAELVVLVVVDGFYLATRAPGSEEHGRLPRVECPAGADLVAAGRALAEATMPNALVNRAFLGATVLDALPDGANGPTRAVALAWRSTTPGPVVAELARHCPERMSITPLVDLDGAGTLDRCVLERFAGTALGRASAEAFPHREVDEGLDRLTATLFDEDGRWLPETVLVVVQHHHVLLIDDRPEVVPGEPDLRVVSEIAERGESARDTAARWLRQQRRITDPSVTLLPLRTRTHTGGVPVRSIAILLPTTVELPHGANPRREERWLPLRHDPAPDDVQGRRAVWAFRLTKEGLDSLAALGHATDGTPAAAVSPISDDRTQS